MIRFVHAADIHLGYEQYNLTERANDFARAFYEVVDYASEEHVDFVLIAGDLFHKASIDAWTLKQATAGLQRLHDTGIPVLAIEGNHETQHTRKHISWLRYLSTVGLLYLLDFDFDRLGRKVLIPWDEERCVGSYVDIADARIYGVRYAGAQTARLLEELAEQITPDNAAFTIMMLHAGIEGVVPHMHGGLTMAQLVPLRDRIDYVALGHIHKRVQREHWLFNPGSTETCSMEETGPDWPHGFFEVIVQPGSPPTFEVKSHSISGRPFRRITVDVDGARSAEEVFARVEAAIAAHRNVPHGAVIELTLAGAAPFKRQEIPLERIKALLEAAFHPLTARVRNMISPPGLIVDVRERLPRQELERQVMEQLVLQRPEYRDQAAAWTRLILDIKNMARDGAPAASIVDHLETERSRMHICLQPPTSNSSSSEDETPHQFAE
jgi:exonuclease SbcD